MQTLQADYFAAYRSIKLTRDANGVLVVEVHNNGEPFIFTAQDHTEFVDAFYRTAQDRANKIVILTGAGGEFIPDIDFSSFGNVAEPGVWSQVHDEDAQIVDVDHIEPTSDGGLRICALARMSDVAADIESSAPSKKNQCWLVTREERKTVWVYRRKNLAPRSSLRRTHCNAFPLLARARLPWPIGGCPTTGLQDDQDS
jgi:hypothetical protein